jgi:hypothetical protein
MVGQRKRFMIVAALAVTLGWVIAIGGYYLAQNSRMTAEKVRAYAESVDLSKLPAPARAKALQKLADKLNSLPMEERQKARFDRVGQLWFGAMTEPEKSDFIEQTMPAGFKQMISAFEKMPEEKRRKAIDDAFKHLRQARLDLEAGREPQRGPGGPQRGPRGPGGPPISPELEDRVRTIGLRTFFTQSSAQTKAEMAPLLEELQRVMELGGRLHR